ncbi:hypothetical protein E2C01_056531 [Portunus trituberculatus]|uniref:Uncharacterized protein n=1 Tax=Portunus trituberculatus TaxID=210409 RepID=A0A5B7GXZ1_PORTR|nr:hypothetical protein [Portunus trituberculatus]
MFGQLLSDGTPGRNLELWTSDERMAGPKAGGSSGEEWEVDYPCASSSASHLRSYTRLMYCHTLPPIGGQSLQESRVKLFLAR